MILPDEGADRTWPWEDKQPGLMKKLPFQDERGDWWIYRRDDPRMIAPLGPFHTSGGAQDAEVSVQGSPNIPFPGLGHPRPVGKLRHLRTADSNSDPSP